jgi:uncharacterized membrane protein
VADLFSAHALANSQVLLEKIVYLLQQVQHLLLFVMQQESRHSSIAAKETFESVLLSPNVYQVFVIRYPLVHR